MPKRGTNIYKRKDGRWEARFVKEILLDGTKKYGSVYATTYHEAKEKQQYYIEHSNVLKKVACNHSVSDLMFEWLGTIKNTVKILTYQKYEGIIKNHIVEYLGKIPAKNLTGKIIDEFTNIKLQTLSESTVNEILVVIGLAYDYGEKEYNFSKPNYHRVRLPHKEMRVLSNLEQQRLVMYLYNDMDNYKLAILIALYTGIRLGELCALQWEDIKYNSITINKTMHRVKTKNGSQIIVEEPKSESSVREIPIAEFLIPIISQFRSTGSFIKTKNNKPVEPRVLQMKFSEMILECNIEHANFHSLRHTFATRCVELGMDVKSLSEILGHSTVKITLDRYVHSSFEQKQKGMNLLNSASSF